MERNVVTNSTHSKSSVHEGDNSPCARTITLHACGLVPPKGFVRHGTASDQCDAVQTLRASKTVNKGTQFKTEISREGLHTELHLLSLGIVEYIPAIPEHIPLFRNIFLCLQNTLRCFSNPRGGGGQPLCSDRQLTLHLTVGGRPLGEGRGRLGGGVLGGAPGRAVP